VIRDFIGGLLVDLDSVSLRGIGRRREATG
jgi:hypothetical protein